MSLRPLLFAAAFGAALAAPMARACDIALVLAVDVSGSVDAAEYRMQTDGLAMALQDTAVTEALLRGRVALAVVQWSGALETRVSVPWTRIDEPAQVTRLANRIALMPRAFTGGNTAVGDAIDAAADLFSQVRDCAAWVIDVSGDGDENEGFTVGHARRAAYERGIRINGLAIEGAATGRAITNFYRAWVVTPGGFVITAAQHQDFGRAMRAKLLRELIPPMALAPRDDPRWLARLD
jgi:Ca-activated chloride channel family protein